MANTQDTVYITSITGPTTAGNEVDWELFCARRALALLKKRLGMAKTIELLQPDIEETSANFKKWVAASNGKWKVSRTVIRVVGLKAEEFLAYHHTLAHNPPPALAAEPEHFAFGAVDDRVQVVENLGAHVADIRFLFSQDTDIPPEDLDPKFPQLRQVGSGMIGQEKVAVKAAHQFRNTDDGFEAILQIYFPEATPEEVIEGHRQHLAIEHSNWFFQTAASLGRPYKPLTSVG
jgi:uncharacterized protein